MDIMENRYVYVKEVDNVNHGVYFKITDTKTGLKNCDHEIQLTNLDVSKNTFSSYCDEVDNIFTSKCKNLNDLDKEDYTNKEFLSTFDKENEKNYYGEKNSPYEAIKIINNLNLNFNRGNVLKYVLRAGKKYEDKEVEDLIKAKNYIDYEIERLKIMNKH
jgi:hypothetical protein